MGLCVGEKVHSDWRTCGFNYWGLLVKCKIGGMAIGSQAQAKKIHHLTGDLKKWKNGDFGRHGVVEK